MITIYTILVVDDDPHILTLVEAILSMEKYKVLTASNGRECLRIIENTKPDLVLLDVMMPFMNGWQVCEKRKKDEKTKDIIVVMMTAKEKVLFYSLGKSLGAADYIGKPFENQDLVNVVKKLLENKAKSSK